MRKNEYWTGFITGALFAAAAALVVVILIHILDARRGYVMSDPEHEARLESLEDLIDLYYLNETDDEELANGVYKGLIEGLGDRYSCYYTAEEYAGQAENNEGTYEGIGVLITDLPDGTILIEECYEGSPGSAVGLRKNDIITMVDGESVKEMSLTDVVDRIQSTDSGSVTVAILRETEDGGSEELEITVPVAHVELPSVFSEMMEDKTGYILISEFKSVTVHQFSDAYDSLSAEGMEKLIIDLRGNPGGYLDVVCDILRRILPKGLIVYTEDKNGVREEEYSEGESPIQIPLAVLVDEKSASASEIFAGAVKDYKIGTIVGMTTYGKGIVQSIRVYQDGSAVKLTTSHYYTPAGHDIHEVGITPDVEVAMDKDVLLSEGDIQLQKAVEILRSSANQKEKTG